MTRFVLILSLLVNTSAFGGNYVAGSELGQDGAKVFPDFSAGRCEAEKGEACYDVTGKPFSEHSVQSVQVDDTSKPLYGPKLKVSGAHADLAACQAAMPGHCDDQSPGYAVREVCAQEADPSTDYELYCIAADPQSYEQMSVNQLLPDSSKQAAKAAADAYEAAVRQVIARKEFGKRLSAEMAVRNAQKGLSVGQKKQVRSDLADVISALEQGDLEGARADIVAITPDGVRTTQADKDWAIAQIDAYLASE